MELVLYLYTNMMRTELPRKVRVVGMQIIIPDQVGRLAGVIAYFCTYAKISYVIEFCFYIC